MNKCSNCGNEFEGKFCTKCGTEFVPPAQSFCKMCGTQLKEGAAFCHKCGYNPSTGAQPTPAQQPAPAGQAVQQPEPARQPKPENQPDPPQEKELSPFKMAFKVAKAPAIISIISLVLGVVFFIIAIATGGGTGWLIAALIFVVSGVGMIIITTGEAKKGFRAVCPECKKLMGQGGGTVYEYECTSYKGNYKSSGEFVDYTFIYTCTIECPHCGSTSTFEYKTKAKNASKADVDVDKYMKEILKMKG